MYGVVGIYGLQINHSAVRDLGSITEAMQLQGGDIATAGEIAAWNQMLM